MTQNLNKILAQILECYLGCLGGVRASPCYFYIYLCKAEETLQGNSKDLNQCSKFLLLKYKGKLFLLFYH